MLWVLKYVISSGLRFYVITIKCLVYPLVNEVSKFRFKVESSKYIITKKSFIFPGNNFFSKLFFLKYFLVDRLANAKNFFWLAIFYRKIGPKMTFDFEDPGKQVEIFQLVLFISCPNNYFYHKRLLPSKYWQFGLRERYMIIEITRVHNVQKKTFENELKIFFF